MRVAQRAHLILIGFQVRKQLRAHGFGAYRIMLAGDLFFSERRFSINTGNSATQHGKADLVAFEPWPKPSVVQDLSRITQVCIATASLYSSRLKGYSEC